MYPWSQFTIRSAAPTDASALDRLAALDSSRPLSGEILLAEMDVGIVAAIAMSDGRVIADPFGPTAALVDALRTTRDNHVRHGTSPSLRDRIRASLRPAPAARAVA